MKVNKVEILLFILLLLLTLFLLNYLFHNTIVENVSKGFTSISTPFFSLRNYLNNLLVKEKVIYKINFLNEDLDSLIPLNYTIEGIYFFEIKKPGVILTTDNYFVGIAEHTGKFVYVKKWWYDEINVTIETDRFEIEAYIKNGKLYFDDKVDIQDAKVYYSKYMPYGLLLYRKGIVLGEIKDGVFVKNIPEISLKTKFVILENYVD
ncbi:MAG: hypothetical protein H0Z24_01870 [Thermosipho sp. (in: Bacteria)]|nr:hypothetical protein [Thermosipho sp. (in: thermotogales)]